LGLKKISFFILHHFDPIRVNCCIICLTFCQKWIEKQQTAYEQQCNS